MTSFPPKYPAKFKPGQTVTVVVGLYRGKSVKVMSIEPGYPYANYKVEHETDGELNLNERELGLIKKEIKRARPATTPDVAT